MQLYYMDRYAVFDRSGTYLTPQSALPDRRTQRGGLSNYVLEHPYRSYIIAFAIAAILSIGNGLIG